MCHDKPQHRIPSGEPRLDPHDQRRRRPPRRVLRTGHRHGRHMADARFRRARPAGTLAIGSTRTVALFSPGSARAADNHTAIIEFLVDDVDTEYDRIRKLSIDLSVDFVNEPTTMPWGNRSLLFRDPDGNLVNFFTPVTPEAKAKVRPLTPASDQAGTAGGRRTRRTWTWTWTVLM